MTAAPAPAAEDFSSLSIAKLKDRPKELGATTSGGKEALVERLTTLSSVAPAKANAKAKAEASAPAPPAKAKAEVPKAKASDLFVKKWSMKCLYQKMFDKNNGLRFR